MLFSRDLSCFLNWKMMSASGQFCSCLQLFLFLALLNYPGFLEWYSTNLKGISSLCSWSFEERNFLCYCFNILLKTEKFIYSCICRGGCFSLFLFAAFRVFVNFFTYVLFLTLSSTSPQPQLPMVHLIMTLHFPGS